MIEDAMGIKTLVMRTLKVPPYNARVLQQSRPVALESLAAIKAYSTVKVPPAGQCPYVLVSLDNHDL